MKNTENDIAQQDKPGGKYAQKTQTTPRNS